MQGVSKPVNVGQAPVYGQVDLPSSPSSPSTSDSVGHVLDGDDYRGTTMSADQRYFAMAYLEKRDATNMELLHEIDRVKREQEQVRREGELDQLQLDAEQALLALINVKYTQTKLTSRHSGLTLTCPKVRRRLGPAGCAARRREALQPWPRV